MHMEAAAKAICDIDGFDYDAAPEDDTFEEGKGITYGKNRYRNYAKAAIDAHANSLAKMIHDSLFQRTIETNGRVIERLGE